MNSITSGLSGLALRRDGVKSNVHSGSTLESYVLPANLRIDDNEMNLALSCMEVIKVSKVSIHMLCCDQSQQTYHMLIYYFHYLLFKIKNGKQQTRRLGISSNHRSILITSNRPQGKVMGLLKRNNAAADGGSTGGSGAASSAATVPTNELDLSMIVRLQLGQQSRRFFKAR